MLCNCLPMELHVKELYTHGYEKRVRAGTGAINGCSLITVFITREGDMKEGADIPRGLNEQAGAINGCSSITAFMTREGDMKESADMPRGLNEQAFRCFHAYRKNNVFQTDQSMTTVRITHTSMKTKLWDIEEDLAQSGVVEADLVQNEGSWIRFNINRGGGGHLCKSTKTREAE